MTFRAAKSAQADSAARGERASGAMGDLTLDEVEQLRALLDDYKTALANNTAFGGIAKDARVNTSLSTFAVDMDVVRRRACRALRLEFLYLPLCRTVSSGALLGRAQVVMA